MNTYNEFEFDALSAICEHDHFWNNLSDEKKEELLQSLEVSDPYMADLIVNIRDKKTFEKDFGDYKVVYEDGRFRKILN
ncbi:hypothetical protein [Paenibacillus xylanexedens]|uniref:hypothetical protein n=1 Tax=Paenibacillus xylanexedens TaxID=528191 RepID=UPI000F530062|nr:hypothetical protein [Paenibacillus xylanexedens]RPK29391.1 hypothetical protein EDO6_00014 [Paenibacillus xylanexedens]